MKTQKQIWELWGYDVWGNEDDGFEVNDRHCLNRKIEIEVEGTIYNEGTSWEFIAYDISDEQLLGILQDYFTIDSINEIEILGGGKNYFINSADNYYPLCDLNQTIPGYGEK
jgi:hypothetical protein